MNDLFATEPACVQTSRDLRLLLSRFGPFTGRYIADPPSQWIADVRRMAREWSELEQARVDQLLRRALEGSVFFHDTCLQWNMAMSWLANVSRLLTGDPRPIEGAIAGTACELPFVFSFEDLDLPPTADEMIKARPHEFARICRTILHLGPELVLVDPYLRLAERGIADVLEAMLAVIAKGKASKLSIWSRAKEVLREGTTETTVGDALSKMVDQSPLPTDFLVEMRLVDDSRSEHRMHARYLLSIKGGVRSDQGFQKLRGDRRVEVGPVGEKTLGEAIRIYLAGKNDMKIEHLVSKRKA